ncbi:MAG: transcriptional repressor LexA [Phycisphaerales bacterium]|nr:transcriptional repressor LexA [Phycisphaerales bacterium]
MNLTPKQMRIFNFVRQFRLLNGYSPTLQEIADELQVSKVTVFEHVEALVEKGALRRNPNKARSLSEVESAVRPDEASGMSIPLLGRIAAGMPIERCAEDEKLQLEAIFGRTTARRGDMFALQVEGESMRDEGILDGDYVIVERRSTARNGERVVALLPNGETTLKSFYREKSGLIRLQPANPEFEPILVEDCTIQGVVIGVLRRY